MNEPDGPPTRPCRRPACHRARCRRSRHRSGGPAGPRFATGLLIQVVLALVTLFRE
ncbi:hypothetical protein [Saccharothrix lopnurensis]|uniref:Uncharacterized protein n=1 Tax=Saccharothrix lopnurensis TaxID=1670621 RepID=A0ABW1P735_9PSEU